MNHLPFKDWLLSDEPLTEDQDLAFTAHLRECAECRQTQSAWAEVSGLFQHVNQVTPKVGFTGRWQERVTARRTRQQRIHIGLAVGMGVILSLALLLLVGTQLFTLIHYPTQFLLLCLAQIASVVMFMSSLQDYLIVIFKNIPLIPVAGLLLSLGLISLLGIGWLAAFQQIVIARRFAK